MLISLIVPVFNEQQAIALFIEQVKKNQALSAYKLEIIFINDGSSDQTATIISELAVQDPSIVAVHFSRNFGKEAALLAGLFQSSGDAIIPIDVDLQDPIEVIPQLIEKWQQGYQVVLARRGDRASDNYLKRVTSGWFYKLYNSIVDNKIVGNVGDFRLMSREVVEAIKQLPENNLFMKGLLSWVGFSTAVVDYKRPERSIGNSKFNFKKLVNLALEGITSFSNVPLRFWTYLGGTVALISFFAAMKIIIAKLIWGNAVAGYSSLMVAILFLGGVQLIGIGVLGEYIGKIYKETKRRPRYIIQSVVQQKNNKQSNPVIDHEKD